MHMRAHYLYCRMANLSTMEMTGATMEAAVAALTKSAPSLMPKFLVFHSDFDLRVLAGKPTVEVLGIGARLSFGAGVGVGGLSKGLSLMAGALRDRGC